MFWSLLNGAIHLHTSSSLELPEMPIKGFLSYTTGIFQRGIITDEEVATEQKSNEQFSFDL